MNTMNAMERLNAATNNVDNAAMNRILDGSINLDGLHAMKNIDMNKCETPIQVMQKIYNAESLVGAVTTVVGNICNVDVTIPEGFAEFKESLLQLKDKAVHVPYGDSIWVDGVNVLRGYHFVTGHFYCYYVVTNAEMKAIETKVKDMSKQQMTVEDALKAGDKIQLVGFGTFEVRERAARECINPQTKAKVKVAASKVPAFKAGQALKNIVK